MKNIFKVILGLLLLSMLAFPGVAAPVTNGLVASYNGNITGNVLLDESGNYNNGYLINAVQGTLLSTGANYVSFSGSNSQANILNNASTNITSEISVEFIGSINEFSSYGAIVSKYSDENGTGWYLSCRNDTSLKKIVFGMFDANGKLHHFRSDIPLVPGQVYDIVVTYDGNIAHVYVNGVDSSSDENPVWAVPMSGNNYNTSIAYAENGLNYLNCNMLAFRLYNRTLSPDEVWQNYVYDLPLYKVTPAVIWSNPADMISGTALSSIQLNAVANDPKTGNQVLGNFTYTPASGTVLNVGTHTLHVDFMPTDAANYTNATANVTINVTTDVPPVANFIADVTSGSAPLSVQFTDLSENATAWSWNFGDGNSSTEQNPVHTYSAAGDYTVSLNASNAYGYNISTKPVLINVKEPPVTNGLVVYYDGTLSGDSLVDLSGNSNTGYATSVTQGIDPITGVKYINLNGVNSKIDISNNAQTNISSPVSIEFIGSINTFRRYDALVSKYAGSSGWYLSFSSDDPYNRVRFNVIRENGITPYWYNSNVNLVANQIYHIVATYDNNTSHIYFNGEEGPDDTRIWNSPAVGNNKNITIGSGYDLNYSNCSMYTFRLYNRSLTKAEVKQNYNSWIGVRDPDTNITMIKKLAYGNGGLPRYMGSHAMSQSESGVSLVDSNLSSLGLVLTPYYQDNGNAETNYTLLSSSVSGIKWKNYYAHGSSASLSFSGNNRTRLENFSLSNDSLHLSNSVTYNGDTLVTKEAVPVTGNAFQFYGDGLNTISGNTVQAYTDNGEIQNDCIFNSSGDPIYSYYQNRTAGITRSNSVDLPLSSPQLTPMPCPSGYLGSLSFAIHADAQDPDSLKTMMYGTNDINDPENSTQGYIGHGLICTWAAFAASSGGAGVGFDNISFKSTLDDMHEKGFEIVPHNVIGWAGEGNPTRETVEYYFPWYTSNYSSRNWIDHGLNDGNRNSGLKSLGLDKNSSQYYIGDLLREHEVKYAWAYQDLSPERGLSTSRTQSLGLPYDIVWTNTNFTWDDGTPIYEWTSTYAQEKASLDYFKNSTLQTMLNNYGVCFWHDYTAYNGETFGDYYFTKGNPYRINETYDNLLLNISEQNKAGRLWNPTVSQYIDYWRAACNVECKCTGQDTYTLINHNSTPVPGYAMRVNGSYAVKLDGNDLVTIKNGDDTVFWMDLSQGTHLLTLVRA